uniref:Uncharacterized protein n=1 Tax=Tanacetum cinerariifolium TaxID=118510 RepID=A0A6L2MKJ6_TANCI|nr:hypothetical protein [Tanacetum cinerariifolium]
MSRYKAIFVTPCHTKKIFANIKRQGKDFSGRITPLFATMMVEAQVDIELIPNETTKESVPTHYNNPLLSGEDRLKLIELMDIYTKLSDRVLSLEHIKTNQAAKIKNLKKKEDASNQGRKIAALDADEALMEIKTSKPKVKIIVILEHSEVTTITTIPIQPSSKDKGKAIMVEPKKPLKKKAQIQGDEELAQWLFAEEQAQFEKEQRIARENAAE